MAEDAPDAVAIGIAHAFAPAFRCAREGRMNARETRVRGSKIQRIRRYWRGKVEKHLCDRGLVSERAWKAMFVQLASDVAFAAAEIGRIGEATEDVGFDPREPLVWAWCVLDTMPGDHDQRYQRLRERTASGTGIEDRADTIRQHGYAMAGLPSAIELQVPWLAALARALDDELAALQYWPEDVSEWCEDDWRPPGYECFVVPVRREHRLADGRPVQRRGLLHHAVMPSRVGSLRVELHLHPDAPNRELEVDPENWVFGCATFPGMTVVPLETAGDGFLLTAAPLSDEAAVVANQVAGARTAEADVAIWPELTMPPDRLTLITELLSADPLAGGRIPLVVAGSWHVTRPPDEPGVADADVDANATVTTEAEADVRSDAEESVADDPEGFGDAECSESSESSEGSEGSEGDAEADRHVNRSHVMLGHGEPFLTYDKRRRFPYQHLTEDIRTGRSLPVIVMENRLVGIAICRDNCDDNAKEGYGALPLDLLIVPSMGAESTVMAHQRHAQGQRSRQGTVTVVVQQGLAVDGSPPPPGPQAYSFVWPDSDGRPASPQAEAFRTLNKETGA